MVVLPGKKLLNMSLDMSHPFLKIIETPIKVENNMADAGDKRKKFLMNKKNKKVAGSIDMFANLNKEAQHHLKKRNNIEES